MILVIAEKPSVAQSIAKVLGATSRKDGYLEGNNYIVSWCVGHLVGLADASSYNERYRDCTVSYIWWRRAVDEKAKCFLVGSQHIMFYNHSHRSDSNPIPRFILNSVLSHNQDSLSETNSTMSEILQFRAIHILRRASIETSSPFLSFVMVLDDKPLALCKSPLLMSLSTSNFQSFL